MLIQLAMIFTPLSEGREERLLNPHVEGPRTAPHPGHHADVCAACQMFSVHGRTEGRSELSVTPQSVVRCGVLAVALAPGVERDSSNCSRAPPTSL